MGIPRPFRLALPRRGAFAGVDCARHRRSAVAPGVLLQPRRHLRRDRHCATDRRHLRPCGRHRARRQPLPVESLRALSLLSRTHAEDHLPADLHHVVRRGNALEDRARHLLLFLSGRAQRRRRHASDRPRANPRRAELSRRNAANGLEDLSSGDAPSHHQRRAARLRLCAHRHAAGRDATVEQRRRLFNHAGRLRPSTCRACTPC